MAATTLDDEERERLHQSIERGLEDVKAGRTIDAREVIAELRARAARWCADDREKLRAAIQCGVEQGRSGHARPIEEALVDIRKPRS